MSSFNGGRVQAQSQSLLGGGDYVLINHMKTMQEWTQGGANVNPDHMDIDGYMINAVNGAFSNILFLPPSKCDNTTKWVMTWDGRGSCFFFPTNGAGINITLGSFNNTSGAASNRVEFTIGTSFDGSCSIGISGIASSADYPHNMKLFMLSDESDMLAGFITASKFRNLMIAGQIGVLRDLNWGGPTNFSNVTNWNSRKRASYYSYQASDYRGAAWGAGALYAGITTGTGDAYAVTISGSSGVAPVHNQIVQVQFDHNSVGTAWTFALNGTPALPMLEAYANGYFNGAGGANPAANNLCTLVFDADLQTWLKYGGGSGGHLGINNGVPPEVFVQVCAEIGAHPYFVCPPLAADPVTDYMSQIDAYIQASGPAWMIPRYEGPNENWNTQFFVNSLSLLKAQVYWGTSFGGNYYWCGRMSTKLAQSIASGRPTPKVGYQVLVGVQSSLYATASFSNPRLNSPREKGFVAASFTNGSPNILATGNTFSLNDPVVIVPQNTGSMPINFQTDTIYFVKTTGGTITLTATSGGTTAIQAGSAGTGNFTICNAITSSANYAYNNVTTVCVTNYANANATNTVGEIATGYRLLAGDTSQIVTYASANDMGPTGLRLSYDAWFAWANSFGPSLKLCGYEGGWSQDYIQNFFSYYGLPTAATQAAQCKITIPNTNFGTFANQDLKAGNPFVVGMPVRCDFAVGMTQLSLPFPKNIGISTGSPGTINYGSAHGLNIGDTVAFTCGGNAAFIKFDSNWDMPAIVGGGFLTPGIAYYVQNNAPGGDNTKFTISATNGGAAINLSAGPIAANITMSQCYLVTAVSGNDVTLNVDSRLFSPFVFGDNKVNPGGTWDNGSGSAGTATYINAIRVASKWASSLRADTKTSYEQMYAAGGEFPSIFQIASSANAWSVWDPDIYESPAPPYSTAIPPQWLGLLDFNGGVTPPPPPVITGGRGTHLKMRLHLH